jgi:hypothetical protein
MLADSADISLPELFVAHGIEVAVSAFAPAEGDMDINAQGLLVFSCKNRHGILRNSKLQITNDK